VSKDIKVTDKRIFTPDGALKDEFRHLEEQAAAAAAAAPPSPAPAPPEPEPPPPPRPEPERPRGAPQPQGGRGAMPPGYDPEPSPRLELPGTPPGLGAPTFYDLVAILAEPVAIYLGDAQLPDGGSVENLEMARLHIDLLDVLRQKTAGHLTAQESAVLEDLLYRLRLRYVQKRG
jgi:hypothetical protein